MISCGHLIELPAKKKALTDGFGMLTRDLGVIASPLPTRCWQHHAVLQSGPAQLTAGQHTVPCKQPPARAHLPAQCSGQKAAKGRGSPGFPRSAVSDPAQPRHLLASQWHPVASKNGVTDGLFRMVPIRRVPGTGLSSGQTGWEHRSDQMQL